MKEEDVDAKSYEKMESQTEQIRYEFTNQDTIVLRKSGMYHKAMGNSAVMLKMLGGKTKIRSHFDTVMKQEVLEMSFHVGKIEATKGYLVKLGKVLRDDGWFFVVRLAKPFDAKKIKRARSNAVLKGEVAEDILLKRRNETALAKEVREIFKIAGLLVRTFKGTDGAVLGRMILEEIMKLQAAVRVLMRTGGDKAVIRVEIDDISDNLQGLLLLAPNFALQADRLSKMGRSLNYIRTEVEGKKEKEGVKKKEGDGTVKGGDGEEKKADV